MIPYIKLYATCSQCNRMGMILSPKAQDVRNIIEEEQRRERVCVCGNKTYFLHWEAVNGN